MDKEFAPNKEKVFSLNVGLEWRVEEGVLHTKGGEPLSGREHWSVGVTNPLCTSSV